MIYHIGLLCVAFLIKIIFLVPVKGAESTCSSNFGQIIELDWSACFDQKYDNLTANLIFNSIKEPFQITYLTQKRAEICIESNSFDGFIYLDDGSIGFKQQNVQINSQQTQITAKLNQSQESIFIYIRQAYFQGCQDNQNSFNSYAKDGTTISCDTPHTNLVIDYCQIYA